jgi:hypothetical protein
LGECILCLAGLKYFSVAYEDASSLPLIGDSVESRSSASARDLENDLLSGEECLELLLSVAIGPIKRLVGESLGPGISKWEGLDFRSPEEKRGLEGI